MLIVDDEVDVVEIMEFLVTECFPEGTEIISANSGNEAIKKLRSETFVDFCLCDNSMPDGMGSVVLQHIIADQLKTKFVVCSTLTKDDLPVEYSRNHVYHSIQKPDIGSGIEELAHKFQHSHTTKNEAALFSPISLHILSMMGAVPEDLYLRMTDNKFIKCMNKAETFTETDRAKYSAKSIEILFIKKGENKDFVKQVILSTLEKIMEKRSLQLAEKMAIAHAELLDLVKVTGVTEELSEACRKNIDQSSRLLMKSELTAAFWSDLNLLGSYPSRLYTLHSMLASVVVKKLKWHSEATMFKLTMASFLQDMTLESIALMEICDYQEFLEKAPTLSSADKKNYLQHPAEASRISSSFKEVPPDIDRILLEQHEMPNGDGFPRKLNANQLGPLSCVFIITGFFARQILKEGSLFDHSRFVDLLEKKGYSHGNFKDSYLIIKSYIK